MTVVRSLLLLAAAASIAAAADFNGTWTAFFTGPESEQPKVASEMVFHLASQGDRLTGTAHLGSWSRDCAITDGRIEGSRFTFTVQTQSAWWNSGARSHASGLAKLTFHGVLKDGAMDIRLVWDSVMLYGRRPAPSQFPMHGVRVETAGR